MRRYAVPTLSTPFGVERNPSFECTFLSSGRSFIATVRARNPQAAVEEGLIELAQQCPDFEPENARAVRVVQTL